MRQRYSLALAAPQRVSLPWNADSITVSNLSQYTLLVRVGADSAPVAVADADYIVPPLGLEVIPVAGKLFGFLLTATPSLSNAPPGMPSTCQAVISAGERTPAFASANLASIYLATAQTLIRRRPDSAAGVFGEGPYSVPSNTRTLHLTGISADMLDIAVLGVQSGIFYVNGGYPWTTTLLQSFPFFPALDSQVQVIGNGGGTHNNYTLLASAETAPPGYWAENRKQEILAEQKGNWSVAAAQSGAWSVAQSGAWSVAATQSGVWSVTARPPARTLTQLAASAVRNVTATYGPITADGARGVRLYLNVTAVPGAQTLTLNLRALNNLRANTYDIAAATAAINATGMYIAEYYPGADAPIAGNTVARQSIRLPIDAYALVNHSGAGNWTYSIDYELLD